MNKDKEYQYVYSLKCAGYLMMVGYPILFIKKNKQYPDKNVYVFNKSSEILKSIDDYKRAADIEVSVLFK